MISLLWGFVMSCDIVIFSRHKSKMPEELSRLQATPRASTHGVSEFSGNACPVEFKLFRLDGVFAENFFLYGGV